MNAANPDIAISSEIQTILDRYKKVTIRHPNLGVTTVPPSVYTVYLAAIKAHYTIAFLMEIRRNPSIAMRTYDYFVSMMDQSDDLPWFSDADVANRSQLIEQANTDLTKCTLYLAELGYYDLLE